jgi:mannose-6-phosphate isomerase-like protein (cupin superfamily)
MAKPGEVLDVPRWGRKLEFKATAAETKGEYLEAVIYLKPSAGEAVEHIHENTHERYIILSGTMRASLDGKQLRLKAGDVLDIPQGTRHINPWNNSRKEASMQLWLSPENGYAEFLELMYHIAAVDKLTRKKDLNPVQYATIGERIPAVDYLTNMPIIAQQVGSPVVAAFGRLTDALRENESDGLLPPQVAVKNNSKN